MRTEEQREAYNARARQWYAAHRDALLEKQKEARQRNPELIREKDRAAYHAHREARCKKSRERRLVKREHYLVWQRAWNAAHAEERRAYMRLYTKRPDARVKHNAWAAAKRKKCPEVGRDYTRHYRERLKTRLAGRPRPDACEICGHPGTKGGKPLRFDHDHATGIFRGWLCHNCNAVLGLVNDDPEILLKLVDYLQRSRALRAVPSV